MIDQTSPCGDLQKHSWGFLRVGESPSHTVVQCRPKLNATTGHSTTRLRGTAEAKNARGHGNEMGDKKSLVGDGRVGDERAKSCIHAMSEIPNTPERCQIETVGAAGLQVCHTLSPLFAFDSLAVRRLGSDALVGFQVTPQAREAIY